MAQTSLGAAKINAARIGIPLTAYLAHQAKGLKWCVGCKRWQQIAAFGVDATRGDGRAPYCRTSLSARRQELYIPKPRLRFGPVAKPGRAGDKVQARQRINAEVKNGRRPHPNSLPCADCGHVWSRGGRRHEYDHYLGYAPEHQLDVEPACSKCHKNRARDRGEMTYDHLRVAAAAKSARRKTHCRFGHPMERFADGHWRCHQCRLEYWKRYNARRSNGS